MEQQYLVIENRVNLLVRQLVNLLVKQLAANSTLETVRKNSNGSKRATDYRILYWKFVLILFNTPNGHITSYLENS